MLLEGRTAIVSGIGPGMGREISLALAREGADIVLGARNDANLTPVAEAVEELGRRAVWKTCDITEPEQCEALVATAADAFGRVDILVNNAFRDGYIVPFEEADLEQWRGAMDTNFFGTLHLTRAALPHLKESGNGRIVMINTMSTQLVEPAMGSYAASKSALAMATRTLATELGTYGIRVNGIHPGYIWGPNVEWYFDHLATERGVTAKEVYDDVASNSALGYIAPAAEIAGTVVYLASDLSRPVTGQAINTSCGEWMG